ncbi:unnamed protein product, partial [Brassica rapa subsp. trilocularis]
VERTDFPLFVCFCDRTKKDETRKQCNDPTCQNKVFFLVFDEDNNLCRKTENFIGELLKQWKEKNRAYGNTKQRRVIYIRWPVNAAAGYGWV